MADFRKQFASDGRWDNGGGHKVENLTKYTDDRKAMWITAVDELHVRGDPTPIKTALWQVGGILPTLKHGTTPNPVFVKMQTNISSRSSIRP
eukprot:COSAG02_NODE_762_length_17464_cov_12.006219_2_plen_92_part_00